MTGPIDQRWASALAYLSTAGAPKAQQLERFNPRPRGQVRPGSAADAVLRLLRANPERFYWRHQLIHITGRTRKAVDWALEYLQGLQLIDAFEIPGAEIGGCMRQSKVRFRIRSERADEGEATAAGTWSDATATPRTTKPKD